MRKLVILLSLIFIIPLISFLIFQDTRKPASQNPGDDGIILTDSEIDGTAKKAIKKKLIESIEENSDSDSFELSWSNFSIQKEKSQFMLCELYPHFQIEIIAPEISVNGEHPRRAYYGSCTDSHTTPVQITLSKSEMHSQISSLGPTTKFDSPLKAITLVSSDDDIPMNWRIDKIVFMSAAPSKENAIILTNYEILSIRGKSIEYTLNTK